VHDLLYELADALVNTLKPSMSVFLSSFVADLQDCKIVFLALQALYPEQAALEYTLSWL